MIFYNIETYFLNSTYSFEIYSCCYIALIQTFIKAQLVNMLGFVGRQSVGTTCSVVEVQK